ncbi:hypothetical protein CMU30_13940 [Elizabethkingia anophelis]|nr:hypothetical protein [Elizabethkingia anophelis]MDV3684380.1 hypothetical protein [Elizabethkingia anophelis]MDV3699723.1 hypothetical protein [Elizabethkingia anophelis]MDV3763624.1 hypothetical protein [Elizabethkingia anophelis]MDV3802641.1 hypothetical protein [Elizabethkingia anophelis]
MSELAENNIIAQLKLHEEINWEYARLTSSVNDTAKHMRTKMLERKLTDDRFYFGKDEFYEIMTIVDSLCETQLSKLNSGTKDSIKDIEYKKSILKILKA